MITFGGTGSTAFLGILKVPENQTKKTLRITAPVDSKVGMGKKILELSLTEEIDQGMLMFIIRIGSDALIWPFYQAVVCLKAGVWGESGVTAKGSGT